VLPNSGMIEHTLNDHFIQVDMSFDPAFASMPVDKADRRPHEFGAAQGHQPLLPGHAFQLNQAKKEDPQELYQMDHMVEAAQVKLIKEFEALQAQERTPTDEQDDEGESEIKVDDRNVPDDYYPSGSEAGDLSDEEDALAENEDEDEDKEMEEVVIQEGWVVQGAQYLDNHGQGVQTIESSALVPKPRTLDKQQDKDIEVTIRRGNRFPLGLVNASSENHNDPFAIAAILREKPGEIGHITQMVCFVVTTLHSLAGLATSWCEFLLEVFIVLFNAMG